MTAHKKKPCVGCGRPAAEVQQPPYLGHAKRCPLVREWTVAFSENRSLTDADEIARFVDECLRRPDDDVSARGREALIARIAAFAENARQAAHDRLCDLGGEHHWDTCPEPAATLRAERAQAGKELEHWMRQVNELETKLKAERAERETQQAKLAASERVVEAAGRIEAMEPFMGEMPRFGLLDSREFWETLRNLCAAVVAFEAIANAERKAGTDGGCSLITRIATTLRVERAQREEVEKTSRGYERGWRALRSLLRLPAESPDGGGDVLDALARLERVVEAAREWHRLRHAEGIRVMTYAHTERIERAEHALDDALAALGTEAAQRAPSESLRWLYEHSGVAHIPPTERDRFQEGFALAIEEGMRLLRSEGR